MKTIQRIITPILALCAFAIGLSGHDMAASRAKGKPAIPDFTQGDKSDGSHAEFLFK